MKFVLEMKLPFPPEYLHYKYKWQIGFCHGAIREYKRFAYLALISSEMITPSEVVDEVWHCHILHTKEYDLFAQQCGKKLHHMPGMPNERERFQPHYDATHQMYAKVFGEDPPAQYWPRKKPLAEGERSGAIENVLNLYLETAEKLRAAG